MMYKKDKKMKKYCDHKWIRTTDLPHHNESCFLCKSIGQISIWMILVVYKSSIYDVKNPISLIFWRPQTPHIATIFEKVLQTTLFHVNKSICHILRTICDTLRSIVFINGMKNKNEANNTVFSKVLLRKLEKILKYNQWMMLIH